MLTGGVVAAMAVASLTGAAPAGDRLPTALPGSGYEPRTREATLELPREKAAEIRRDALARAVLWLPPAPALDLSHNAPDLLGGAHEVVRKFYPHKVEGTISKFLCVFEGGEVLKVKYGRNREIYTETAATRLLHVLGAGADSVSLVTRLRCFGCPEDPQVMLRCISSLFRDWARECEPLPERDARRLLAVLLDDWDTREDNQRLVCLDREAKHAECRRPFAYVHDVGATFGSGRGLGRKLDLAGWRALPVWKDEATCPVKLDAPPLAGATFGDAVISERGRQYLARRLARLTTKQIHDVFEGAHFADSPGAKQARADVDEWARTFQDKVRQITARKPCPTP